MDNISWLIATRNDPGSCKINWEGMDTEKLFHHWTLHYAYHVEPVEKRPECLYEMARKWDNTKFCGYFTESFIEALQEFCKNLKPYGKNPRLFYRFLDMHQLWCIEFHPGTEKIQYAIYDYSTHIEEALPNPDLYKDVPMHWELMHNKMCAYIEQKSIDNFNWEFRELTQ